MSVIPSAALQSLFLEYLVLALGTFYAWLSSDFLKVLWRGKVKKYRRMYSAWHGVREQDPRNPVRPLDPVWEDELLLTPEELDKELELATT